MLPEKTGKFLENTGELCYSLIYRRLLADGMLTTNGIASRDLPTSLDQSAADQ